MTHESHPDHPLLPNFREGKGSDPIMCSKLERSSRASTVGQNAAETGHSGRVSVRVTSVRKRLIDEDNLCEKYVVDCCRYAGLIPDDDPGKVKIQVTQRKATKGEAEHTIVEIMDP